MIKLSAVIITYNEEKNIKRCIDSLIPVADEIVIVDSFSEDRTKEICDNYDVKFITHPFEGHIEQKNWAVKQATFDYVLSIDADEALSERLKKSVLEVKENWNADGYFFNRLNNFCGKWIRHSGWYPDRKIRLFIKDKGVWGGVNPHDKFVMNDKAKTLFLKGDLLHYSYYSINEHVEQINKFSSIKARELYKKGKKFTLLRLIFSPLIKFIKGYFIYFGFLDGFFGFVISINSAHSNFLKYVKLREFRKSGLHE